MDEADTAQARIEAEDELRRKERELRPVLTVDDSADDCVECGTQIPSERQIAIPGVEMCVGCQEISERKRR